MSLIAPPCDRGVARSVSAAAPSLGGSTGKLILAGTVLGSSLAFIDGSAVNLALPVIQQQLGGGTAAAQWIINAYLLLLGALVLAGGAAADRYGRRRVFLIGVGVFTVASVLCGLAPNLQLLIAARALQGLGAALLVPASLAILGAAFDKPARSQAVGIWAGASGLASAIGPALAGWLTQAVSWRAVFLLNLPIAALAVGFILAGARESRAPGAGPLDWPGAVSATFGLGAFTWGLTEAPQRGFADPVVLAGLVLGVAAMVAFVWIERRAANPMLPLALFRSPTFAGANGLTLLLYAAFGGALFLLPFQLMRVHGYNPVQAGAALLPLSAGLSVLSPLAGRLAGLWGARALLAAGPLLAGAGFGLLAVTASVESYWTGVFPGLALLALGMGIAVAPLTDTVLEAVSEDYQGAASGVNNAVARVAGLLAVALVGFVFAQGGQGQGGQGPDGLSATAADRAALSTGYQAAMAVAAVLAGLAGLIGATTIRTAPAETAA